MNPPIPSPCISVCQMDSATDYCKGCYRTIEEIMAWGQASDEAKQSMWQQLRQRHKETNFAQAAHHPAFKKLA